MKMKTCPNSDCCKSKPKPNLDDKLKINSSNLTGDKSDSSWLKRAGARGMMRAVGYQDSDFEKPLIGVAAPYTDITPCNKHLWQMSQIIQTELASQGMTSYYIGTPVITDGESMGMEGMKCSLPSRDWIADSIEMMIKGYACDGAITVAGCDKTIPGALMPLLRTNTIGITLYGGSVLPGRLEGQELNIVSIFEAIGAYSSGKISQQKMEEIEKKAIPHCGSCGGMYTANTMATAIEALGMSLPFSSSNPATFYSGRLSEAKYTDCQKSATALKNLLKNQVRPRDIVTKKSFENALTVVMALTGSTNGVLHLLALAKEAEIELSLEDFDKANQKTPILADLKPSGKYVMYDLYKVGGLPVVMKELLEANLLHGDCLSVTGKTLSQNLENIPSIKDIEQFQIEVKYKQEPVVYPVSSPLVAKGHHLISLKGNLAPEGAIFKQSGKYLIDKHHLGTARVFDSEEEAYTAILEDKIQKGDIIVIRYEGPKGGPGMREMLSPTSALAGKGMVYDVPLITDGRFSGGSHGIIVGHITPEASQGGLIALVKDDDKILIDPAKQLLELKVDTQEIEKRSKTYLPKLKPAKGFLAKYRKLVGSASQGAVLG